MILLKDANENILILKTQVVKIVFFPSSSNLKDC